MVAAWDVDGTLIYDGNPKYKFINPETGVEEPLCDTPRYEVIQLFKTYESLGFENIIWSGGGIDYAKRWAARLGLSAKILEKGSIRPDIAFDDLDVRLGVVNIRI